MTKKKVWVVIVGCLSITALIVVFATVALNTIPMYGKPIVTEKTGLSVDEFRNHYQTFPVDIRASSINYYTYSHFQAYVLAIKISCDRSGLKQNAEKVAEWATGNKVKINWAKEKVINQFGLKLPNWMEDKKFDEIFEGAFISVWYNQENNSVYLVQTD